VSSIILEYGCTVTLSEFNNGAITGLIESSWKGTTLKERVKINTVKKRKLKK
jgi:hypothetical protein